MRSEGLPCASTVEKNTDAGIQVVKKWLRNMSSPQPKMYFAKETCESIITEFGLYHFKTDAAGNPTDDPDKANDHWLDALRYPMYELFGKGAMVMVNTDMDSDNHLTDSFGNFARQPSAAEFAKERGIRINPEDENDKSKIGQIINTKNIDDDDDGGTTSGNGSFLWSF
jgi:hypothetical protein